jgi:hypothetical protein
VTGLHMTQGYSLCCLEDVFSETELPVYGILGNSGIETEPH